MEFIEKVLEFSGQMIKQSILYFTGLAGLILFIKSILVRKNNKNDIQNKFCIWRREKNERYTHYSDYDILSEQNWVIRFFLGLRKKDIQKYNRENGERLDVLFTHYAIGQMLFDFIIKLEAYIKTISDHKIGIDGLHAWEDIKGTRIEIDISESIQHITRENIKQYVFEKIVPIIVKSIMIIGKIIKRNGNWLEVTNDILDHYAIASEILRLSFEKDFGYKIPRYKHWQRYDNIINKDN